MYSMGKKTYMWVENYKMNSVLNFFVHVLKVPKYKNKGNLHMTEPKAVLG